MIRIAVLLLTMFIRVVPVSADSMPPTTSSATYRVPGLPRDEHPVSPFQRAVARAIRGFATFFGIATGHVPIEVTLPSSQTADQKAGPDDAPPKKS